MRRSGIPFLLLLILIPSSNTCIPTKTPEPGIPATTTASPYKCPALKMLSVFDCITTIGPQNLVCAGAIFTPASVSCASAGAMLLYKTSATGSGTAAGPLTCKGTEWTQPDGSPLSPANLAAPIACVTQGTG